MDDRDFYISLDTDMLMDTMTTELQYLATSWVGMTGGRPLVVLPVSRKLLVSDGDDVTMHPSFVTMLRKLQSGYLNGVRFEKKTLEKKFNVFYFCSFKYFETSKLVESFN